MAKTKVSIEGVSYYADPEEGTVCQTNGLPIEKQYWYITRTRVDHLASDMKVENIRKRALRVAKRRFDPCDLMNWQRS